MSEVLKCDAENCGHVEQVGKITADMVGMPCPVCGSNLLTEEDWVAWQPISELLDVVNRLGGSGVAGVGDKMSLRVGLHGPKTTIEFDRSTESAKEGE